MTGAYFNENDVRLLYRLLGFNKERVAEVRCIKVQNGGGVVGRGFIESEDEFVGWAKAHNGRGNCFVGRNPRDKEGRIRQISALSLDLDPASYDKTVGADKRQTETCGRFALSVARQYHNATCCISGNGALLLWRIPDVEASDSVKEAIKEVEEEVKKTAPTEVKIDATHDHARLVKLIGTVSVKGGNKPTRFLNLPCLGRYGGWFSVPYKRVGNCKPVSQGTLLGKSNHPSRSEADFALAVHYKQSGLGPTDCLEALQQHALGRPERADDHRRLIEKVYAIQFTPDGFKAYEEANTPQYRTTQNSIEAYKTSLANRGSDEAKGIKTGFAELDTATGGLQKGELWTIGARPGVGKSSLLRGMAYAIASQGKKVLMLTTEMSYQRVFDGLLSSALDIPAVHFRDGTFTDDEQKRIATFLEAQFPKLNITIMDSFSPNPVTVEKAVRDTQPDVLIFDHVNTSKAGILTKHCRGLLRS